MVAVVDATADSTMHREYVINTNTTNYRMGKVLPDTGSTSSNFVGAEEAGRIESVEPKFPSDCYLSTNEHHQPTTAIYLRTSKWPTQDPLLWTRELREFDNAIQIPVDNYQP